MPSIQKFQITGDNVPRQLIPPPGYDSPSTFYNNSANTVEISDTTGGTFIPVTTGTRVTWDANQPLYARATVASQVLLIPNGGSIDDPSVLADLIVNSGLSQDIANDIVASGLAGNIASQIAISGAPPVDPMTVIYDSTFSVNNISGGDSGALGVSGYQSLWILMYNSTAADPTSPTERPVRLNWTLQSGASFTYDAVTAVESGTKGADQYILVNVPVRGNTLTVEGIAGAGTYTMTMKIFGSYKSAPSLKYLLVHDYAITPAPSGSVTDAQGGLITHQWATKAAGTNNNTYPSIVAGRALWTVEANNVTTGGVVVLVDSAKNIVLKSIALAVVAGAQTATEELILPARPILVQWASAIVATSNIKYNLQMLQP